MKTKKWFIGMVVCLMSVFIIGPKLQANTLPSYEFYPQGNNYLDPDNFVYYMSWPYASYHNQHYVKVKPGTEYYLSNMAEYDISITDIEIYAYNETKTLLGMLSFQEDGIHNKIMIPHDVYYIKLDIYVYLFSQESDFMYIDRYLALYEGPVHVGNFVRSEWNYKGYLLDLVPVFDYNSAIFITNINHPIALCDVLLGIKAYDDVDGDITHLIEIIIDEYTPNQDSIGEKRVVLEVKDSAGNASHLQLIFVILDTTAPILTGPSTITTTQHQVLSSQDIISHFSAIDNYEGIISENIRIVRNDYQGSEETIGEYTIELDVMDSSNNRSSLVSTIIVTDSTAPEFIGPTKILKNRSESLSVAYIQSLISAIDNHDGDITHKISVQKDNYSANHNKMGKHTIIFTVKDAANNISTHTVEIEVVDDIAPVFLIDELIIHVDLRYEDLDILDIVNVLLRQNVFTQGDKIEIIEDNYSLNKHTSGTYQVRLKNHEKEILLSIHIIEHLEEINEEKIGFLAAIWNWIIQLITKIIQFFTRIFR